jgi:hypothetical protein
MVNCIKKALIYLIQNTFHPRANSVKCSKGWRNLQGWPKSQLIQPASIYLIFFNSTSISLILSLPLPLPLSALSFLLSNFHSFFFFSIFPFSLLLLLYALVSSIQIIFTVRINTIVLSLRRKVIAHGGLLCHWWRWWLLIITNQLTSEMNMLRKRVGKPKVDGVRY